MNRKQIAAFVNEVDSFTKCQTSKHRQKLTSLISKIIRYTLLYFPHELEKILEAILLSAFHHQGQYRDAGGPYLFHPLRSACALLADGVLDWRIIAIAILHDAREDSKQGGSLQAGRDIKGSFDNYYISQGVLLLTKPDDPDLEKETLPKLIRSSHLGAMLVKVEERTDNLRDLYIFEPEKQKEKLRETKKHFPLLCDRIDELVLEKVRIGELGKRYFGVAKRVRRRLESGLFRYTHIVT